MTEKVGIAIPLEAQIQNKGWTLSLSVILKKNIKESNYN